MHRPIRKEVHPTRTKWNGVTIISYIFHRNTIRFGVVCIRNLKPQREKNHINYRSLSKPRFLRPSQGSTNCISSNWMLQNWIWQWWYLELYSFQYTALLFKTLLISWRCLITCSVNMLILMDVMRFDNITSLHIKRCVLLWHCCTKRTLQRNFAVTTF